MEPLASLLYAFGIVLLAGANLGLFFDFFRVIRGPLRPGHTATPFSDQLFWAAVTPGLALYLFLANWGELRGYEVIGLTLGLFFFRLFLSGLVISVLLWLVDLFRRVLIAFATFVVGLGSLPIQVYQEVRFHYAYRAKARPRTGLLWKTRPRLRWRR